MRAYRWLVALVFMAGGLHAQTVGSLASSACPLGGCAQGGTGTVTTTSTLVSGRVALSSGASSLTDDAGCTVTGTGSSFFASFGGGVITPLYTSGPGKSGTNVAGTNNTIQAEPGTGNATGSSIIFQTPTATTSGTDAQTQATRLTIGEGSIVPTVPIVSAGFVYASGFRGYAGDNLDDIGLSGWRFKTGYFGTSVVSPLLVSGPGKSGTNVGGTNNTIQAEPGTGNATGSSIIFQTPTATTSGTDAQTQATRLTINEGSIVPAVPLVSASFIYATNFRSYTGDNLDDVGQSGAKFKSGYFGTSVVTPVVQLTLATPTTSGDTCTAGTFWADANYLYVCTATNTIKRAALSAF